MQNSDITPKTYPEALEVINKVAAVHRILIQENINDLKFKIQNPYCISPYPNKHGDDFRVKYEEIYASSVHRLHPVCTYERLWYVHGAKETAAKYMNEETIHLEVPDHVYTEEEYFQYSTVHQPYELYVQMLCAKIGTLEHIKTSYKIIIPAFIELYDYIVLNKKPQMYLFDLEYDKEYADSIRFLFALKEQCNE